jgi:hypothetical protein
MSIDYKFQPHCASGARFGYKYQPGTFIYRLDESTTIFMPKLPLDSAVLVNTHCPPHLAKVIGIATYNTSDVCTVIFPDSSISDIQIMSIFLRRVLHPVVNRNRVYFPTGFKLERMQHYFWMICLGLAMVN